jgi:5-oxoprolinase (ATP-hydrolysing) subunit A
MMKAMDINCDCGESFGNWKMGADEELLPLLTTANVACGFHGGDPVTMLQTVKIAKTHNIAVGAHPGLPDLLGFGRRRMEITADEAYAYVLYQSGALRAVLGAQGMELHHVKVHGALYSMLCDDEGLAEAVTDAIIRACPRRLLYWPAPSEAAALPRVARARGVQVVGEIYVDLDYDRDGRLVLQRRKPAADLSRVRARINEFLSTGKVTSTTGEKVELKAESVCIHGDGPNAFDVLETVRDEIVKHGLSIAAINSTQEERGLAAY